MKDELERRRMKGEGPIRLILRPSAFILTKSIAPQLRAHGIFVKVSRSRQGRVVSILRDPKLTQNDRETPNLIADEKFGPEPEIQEDLRYGAPCRKSNATKAVSQRVARVAKFDHTACAREVIALDRDVHASINRPAPCR